MNESGVLCPACKKADALVDARTPTALVLRCPACGYLWRAEQLASKV